MKGKKLLVGILSAAMVIVSAAFTAFADDIDSSATAEATNLPDAINGVITLTEDVITSVVIQSNEEVTIDLNGHKITNASGNHTITNSGTLVIVDSSEDMSGIVDNVTHTKAALYNNQGASAILNGGTFMRSKETGNATVNKNSYYTIANIGDLTINDGVTVENDGNFSSNIVSGCFGNGMTGTPKLVINGGNFSGGVCIVKNDEYGTLEINGGSFNGLYCVQNWNQAVINDGTFSGSKAAIVNTKFDASAGALGKLKITGGIFNQGAVDGIASGLEEYASKDISISGGTFATDVSDYYAPGCVVEKNANGTKTVLSWTTDTDSGSYKSGNDTVGMMRFMFKIEPKSTVKASGIKYIKADDIAAEPTTTGTVNASENLKAFQGDIINIPANENATYFARAYITTDNGTFWSEPVRCSVNWNQFFTNYTGGAQ